MATKKLILDLDMGVDDAMALAYAIASPEVELVGITTCFGNVRVEQSAHNCLAVLDLLGRPEVPVYLGADRPMKATEPYTPPASTTLIHGKNGIGGASVPASPYEPVGATSADGNAAVDYLIDAARTYGPDLVYVATGPLTNLALALERDAAEMMSIGRVVVMGGALTVPGNVSAGAEANNGERPRGGRCRAAFGPQAHYGGAGCDASRGAHAPRRCRLDGLGHYGWLRVCEHGRALYRFVRNERALPGRLRAARSAGGCRGD